jgi:hypothetical protein
LPPSGRVEMNRPRGTRGESTGHASEDVHAGEFVAVGFSAQLREGFNRVAQVDRPAVPDVSSGAAACVRWLRTARVGLCARVQCWVPYISSSSMQNTAMLVSAWLIRALVVTDVGRLIELLGDGTSSMGNLLQAIALAHLAVITLCALAMNGGNKVALAKAGGIAPLIEPLGDGTPGDKEWAAGALAKLALIELLDDGTPGGKDQAAGALWALEANGDSQVTIGEVSGIAPRREPMCRPRMRMGILF